MWREKSGRKEPSLVWAMNDAVKFWFWTAGILGVFGETAQVLTPLLLKVRSYSLNIDMPRLTLLFQKLVAFAEKSYAAHQAGEPVEPIGKGVGYAIGILILQLFSSVTISHFFYRSSLTGVLLRGGLINAIYNRSLRLTTRSRSQHPNGKLVNHISTDVSVSHTSFPTILVIILSSPSVSTSHVASSISPGSTSLF